MLSVGYGVILGLGVRTCKWSLVSGKRVTATLVFKHLFFENLIQVKLVLQLNIDICNNRFFAIAGFLTIIYPDIKMEYDPWY